MGRSPRRHEDGTVIEASVIVVNYRSEDHVCALLELLARVEDDRPAQVIVIDNSPERGLQGRLPATIASDYVRSSYNCGFGTAVNRGVRHARCQTLILLNPDARPEPGCLRGLAETLTAERVAAAGPALLPFDRTNPCVPSAIRVDPGWLTAMVEHTVAHRFASNDWLDRHYFLTPGSGSHLVECAAVQGACMSLSKDWVERIGGFDERFFLYFEETDLCRRLRATGGRVLYCPTLACRHLGGASTTDGRQDRRAYWHSFYAYHRKHGGRVYATLLHASMLVGTASEYAILCVLDLWRRGHDPVLSRDRAALGEQVVLQASSWRR